MAGSASGGQRPSVYNCTSVGLLHQLSKFCISKEKGMNSMLRANIINRVSCRNTPASHGRLAWLVRRNGRHHSSQCKNKQKEKESNSKLPQILVAHAEQEQESDQSAETRDDDTITVNRRETNVLLALSADGDLPGLGTMGFKTRNGVNGLGGTKTAATALGPTDQVGRNTESDVILIALKKRDFLGAVAIIKGFCRHIE